MGCGCGGGRSNRPVVKLQNSQNKSSKRSIKLSCNKCTTGVMVLSQRYSPGDKKYIKTWKCNKCGNTMKGI